MASNDNNINETNIIPTQCNQEVKHKTIKKIKCGSNKATHSGFFDECHVSKLPQNIVARKFSNNYGDQLTKTN